MKSATYIRNKVLLLLILLVAVSCNKSEEKPSPVPYLYDINFKFSDVNGNNLLENIDEDKISNYIEITSENGNIDANAFNIVNLRDQKFLNIKSYNQRRERLKINYAFKNEQLTGTEDVITIKSNWVIEKNNPIPIQVHIDRKDMIQHQVPETISLVYYELIKHSK